MWWLFSLLIMALAAYFAIRAIKASTQKQQAEQERFHEGRLNEPSTASNTETNSAESSPAHATAGPGSFSSTAPVAGAAAVSATVAVAATDAQQEPSDASGSTINTGDTLSDIQEMIKILNLDEPDAGRLHIERSELAALRRGETVGIPDTATLDIVASKLRNMLA